MKEKFLSWQGTKRRELFLSCCGFDSYISFVGKKLLSAFGTVYCNTVHNYFSSCSVTQKTKLFFSEGWSVHAPKTLQSKFWKLWSNIVSKKNGRKSRDTVPLSKDKGLSNAWNSADSS